MIKAPEGLDIEYAEVNTEVGIHFLVSSNFNGVAESIEFGNVWVIVDIPNDFKDETDVFKLVKASSRTLAYVFTGNSSMTEDKVQLETSVGLKAPIAVTFKLPTLPEVFPGSVHEFKDRRSMRRAMKNDYADFENPLGIIELGIYYVCAVLCEDYQGHLDYDYFINNLKYDKLTAYYLEENDKICTFRYKNEYYDK